MTWQPLLSNRQMRGVLLFLKDWLAWAEANANSPPGADRMSFAPSPEDVFYSPSHGICGAALVYVFQAKSEVGLSSHELGREIGFLLQLSASFCKTPHPMPHPFGERDYAQRARQNTQHQCPERLRWVRETITYLEAKFGKVKEIGHARY